MTTAVPLDRVTLLGRRLRAAGLTVTPDTITDMARAARHVGYDRPGDFYFAQRAVVCRDPGEYPTYDRVVRDFLGLVPDDPPDARKVSVLPSTGLMPLGTGDEPADQKIVIEKGFDE